MFLVLCALLMLGGCSRSASYTRPAEAIELKLEPGSYDPVAYVEGEDCVGRYLLVVRVFSPSTSAATERALAKGEGANFLLDRLTQTEERFVVPFVYHRLCRVVEGQAVVLHSAGNAP